jgi:hypothetical protein
VQIAIFVTRSLGGVVLANTSRRGCSRSTDRRRKLGRYWRKVVVALHSATLVVEAVRGAADMYIHAPGGSGHLFREQIVVPE